MFKSSSQLLSVVLGFGLISSNFFTLMILARKDSGIPNLAALPSNQYSSFSIRSEKEGNKHSWTMASNQHDPKKLLYTKEETRPGFKGTTKSYIHKESVAYSTPVIQYEDKGLTAKQIECIKKRSQGESNGEMVGTLGATQVTPALTSVPVVGPVIAGIFFGQARKQAGKAGAAIAADWNDC